MKRARHWVCALLALAAISCGAQTPPPQPASFDRPGRVAFVCFQTDGKSGPKPVPFDRCVTADGLEGANKPNLAMHAIVTQTSRGEVAAVDLEKNRILDSRNDIPGYTFLPVGELPSAVVVPHNHPELTYVANFGSRTISVLRTRAFRQLQVGEDATVQTVPVNPPGSTVAGPVDMVLSPDESALYLALPDAHVLMRMPIRRCAATAGATSSDDAGAAGTDAGAKPACEEGTLDADNATLIPLAKSLPQAVIKNVTGPQVEPYQKACDTSELLSAPVAVPTKLPAVATTQKPEPVSFALDDFCETGKASCTQRLLVADRVLPIVHVIDLATGAVLAPIVTGVPTTSVAVSPRVPKSLKDADGETQYVYAIDATDGSVIVTQNGRVLTVSSDPTSAANRISFGGTLTGATKPVATALSIITPQFDVHGPATQYLVKTATKSTPAGTGLCLADTDRRPSLLRGVFLTVGLSDGSVRVVDIHDLELRACRTCNAAVPDPYPVIRHRPRLNAMLDPAAQEVPRTAPTVTPAFAVDDTSFNVNVDGTTPDVRVEGLSCVPCKAPQLIAFPDPADLLIGTDAGPALVTDSGLDSTTPDVDVSAAVVDAGTDTSAPSDAGAMATGSDGRPRLGVLCSENAARVCSLGDPWVAVNSWGAQFEGLIPGAYGGHGRFIEPSSSENRSGLLELGTEISLCGLGVLGDEDQPKGSHHNGDQLVITATLPSTKVTGLEDGSALRDDCEKLIAARKSGDFSIAFPILRAEDDRLVLDDHLLVPSGAGDLKIPKRTLNHAFVAECFAHMLMTYEVHARGAYRVLGGGAIGFRHRVIKDPNTGRCKVDTKQDPRLDSLAYEDEVYANDQVSFEIASRRTGNAIRRTRPGTSLGLTFGSNVGSLLLDATYTQYGVVNGVQALDLEYNAINQTLYMVDSSSRGLVTIPLDPFPTQIASSFE